MVSVDALDDAGGACVGGDVNGAGGVFSGEGIGVAAGGAAGGGVDGLFGLADGFFAGCEDVFAFLVVCGVARGVFSVVDADGEADCVLERGGVRVCDGGAACDGVDGVGVGWGVFSGASSDDVAAGDCVCAGDGADGGGAGGVLREVQPVYG